MKQSTYFRKWDKVSVAMLMGLFVLLASNSVLAQLRPANAIYYFNEFLMNPSMAGKERVAKAALGYRQQLSSFSGSPQTQFLTVDYGFDKRSGIGLNVYSDKAGLLRETKIAFTYAYHLPLSKNDRLSFGLSGSIMNDRLSNGALKGDLDDPDVIDVDNRKAHIDSDFGMTYTVKKVTVQAVFPNMFATINKDRVDEVDYLLFFSAISYKLQTNLGIVEPKLAFRGIKGFKNVVDLGANLALKSTSASNLNFLAIYHSSKSATVGMGLLFNEKYSFNTSYTIGTSQLNSYAVGDLEIGLALRFN